MNSSRQAKAITPYSAQDEQRLLGLCDLRYGDIKHVPAKELHRAMRQAYQVALTVYRTALRGKLLAA